MYDNQNYDSPDDKAKRFVKSNWKWGALGVLVLVVLAFIFSMAFTVSTDSRSVIFRFGKFTRVAQPGLNFKLPMGIENATTIRTEKVYREVFGFGHNKKGQLLNVAAESLMITGDLSVADVEWIVQYRVTDPAAYLINVRNPNALLRDMAEYAARLAIGDLSLNEVLRNRDLYRADIQQNLQQEMNDVGAGVTIVAIEINDANVPTEVKASYNAVNEAQQEKETMIYEANQAYNDKIPEAKGKAKAIVNEANGKAAEVVNEAKGRVARFLQLREEYQKAKKVTTTRMYLDTMGKIFGKSEIVIVDGELDGILPMLNLNKMGGK